ncbi:hypothetical protein U9M48_007289 [Paspalum notatum var. saurae]|uniref:Uncharacterized protein n=1 Tax=Paspalum notatum var. saurae TaxID=547442 RepID=A0AAQ3Q1A7_PASNO
MSKKILIMCRMNRSPAGLIRSGPPALE